MRFPRPQYHTEYSETGDDSARHTFRIRMNRRERKAALKDRHKFISACREHGILPEPGCHCGHCQRGYDCCGNMFPSSVKVEPAKRGLRLIQFYNRNV